MSDHAYQCPTHGYQIEARCCSLALRLFPSTQISTADNRAVPDELLSAAVRDVTATLNSALAAAYQAGLLVDIDTSTMQEIGRLAPRVTVHVTISRPL